MSYFFRHLLTLLILVPIVGAILMRATRGRLSARWAAFGTTLATLLLSIVVPLAYDAREPLGGGSSYAVRDEAHPGGVVQLAQRVKLVFSLEYFVGVDGLSLPLVLLTAIMGPLIVAASWRVESRIERVFTLILLAESFAIGMFVSLNLVFFFALFIATLVPIFALVRTDERGPDGLSKRHLPPAMIFSGLLLLIALICIFSATHSFDLIALPRVLHAGSAAEKILFLLLMPAFLTRLAAFPLHGWFLRECERPQSIPPISIVMLCAMIQTSGGYGIFRIAYALFPDAARLLWLAFAVLGVAGVFFGAFCSIFESDLRRRIAFLLMPHVGLILLGAAMNTPTALHGAAFLITSLGLAGPLLYLLAGMVIRRTQNADVSACGTLAGRAPVNAGFLAVAMLAACGLPVFSAFVGEFLVLAGTFEAARDGSPLRMAGHASMNSIMTLGIIACIGAALVLICGILTIRRLFVGESERTEWQPEDATQSSNKPADLSEREISIVSPLMALVLVLGIIPGIAWFSFSLPTIDALFRMW